MKRLLKSGIDVGAVPGRGWMHLPTGEMVSPPPDAGWTFQDYEVIEIPDPVTARPTAEERLANLAERRYAAQISGTMLGESRLATDDATRAMLHAARTKIAEDPAYTIPAWKFAPGVFAPLDAATIIAAGDAVFDHVQACFANEAALSALILAADTPEALAAIDLDAGWP